MEQPSNPLYFYVYKSKDGPFIFYFVKNKNASNKNFRKLLEVKKRKYRGVPLIKYNYEEFMGTKYKILSPHYNDILIVEKNHPVIIHNNPDEKFIEKLFKQVENKHLIQKQKVNKEYDQSIICPRKKLRTWKPYPNKTRPVLINKRKIIELPVIISNLDNKTYNKELEKNIKETDQFLMTTKYKTLMSDPSQIKCVSIIKNKTKEEFKYPINENMQKHPRVFNIQKQSNFINSKTSINSYSSSIYLSSNIALNSSKIYKNKSIIYYYRYFL